MESAERMLGRLRFLPVCLQREARPASRRANIAKLMLPCPGILGRVYPIFTLSWDSTALRWWRDNMDSSANRLDAAKGLVFGMTMSASLWALIAMVAAAAV